MSNETKSPTSETHEPQQITPQTDELDEKQLDKASGGYGGGTYLPPPPPPRG
jgi:hypothetical protein